MDELTVRQCRKCRNTRPITDFHRCKHLPSGRRKTCRFCHGALTLGQALEKLAARPARFWSRVNRHAPEPRHVPGIGNCWEWQGATNARGYGILTWERKPSLAHRVAWHLTFGEWPELCCLHRCDNPACVNPSHIFLGTTQENTRDMIAKGRGRYSRGEALTQSKLNEETVREIRLARARGLSWSSIAKQFGTSSSNARDIFYRKTWRHVE